MAGQIEARFNKAQAQVDKMRPSLLARAFSGRLVPQDPNDEPAEKLLERIREQRKRVDEGLSRGHARQKGRPAQQ